VITAKHELVDHEELVRDRRRVVGVGREPHARQPSPLEAADQAAEGIRPEGQAVAEQHPLDRDHAQHDETLLERRQDILAADHPPVEQPQARRHEHHQRRGDHHERRVGRLDLGRRRGGRRHLLRPCNGRDGEQDEQHHRRPHARDQSHRRLQI
jgi:hypothetical protein